MQFTDYIWYFLLHTARSLSTGLQAFFQAFKGTEEISKQAFSKGRKRINPEALAVLAGFTRDQFYRTAEPLLWNGYRVLAIDGSKVDLPTAPELIEHFGIQAGCGGQVQAVASCLYDVLNLTVLHAQMGPVWSSERELASAHIQAFTQLPLAQEPVPSILLFDRGYPAATLLEELEKAKMHYVMRCSTEFLRSVRRDGDDCIVNHRFVAVKRDFRLRVIKVPLENGEYTYFVTNLFDRQLTAKHFYDLYHLRWGIETAYNTMKHKWQMEDFTGRTVDAVLQDFYVTIASVNLMACLFHDNRKAIEEQQKDANNKYKYVQNINHTIGSMRNTLLQIVAAKSARKRRLLCCRLLASTRRNLVAVRSGRSFPRAVKHKSAHYAQNMKRA